MPGEDGLFQSPGSRGSGRFTPSKEQRPQRASLSAFGNVPVPGTRAGAIVSIGLVVLAWIAIPLARPFLLATAGIGGAIGYVLWRWHSKE